MLATKASMNNQYIVVVLLYTIYLSFFLFSQAGRICSLETEPPGACSKVRLKRCVDLRNTEYIELNYHLCENVNFNVDLVSDPFLRYDDTLLSMCDEHEGEGRVWPIDFTHYKAHGNLVSLLGVVSLLKKSTSQGGAIDADKALGHYELDELLRHLRIRMQCRT
jgi:hypothetical protein